MSKKIKNGGNWLWSAGGKHPVARDFFITGDNSPLAQAFFDWAERGAESLITKNGKDASAHSFRFWSKGSAADQLVCGLVRSSCDQLGRPYPLMLLGSGMLPDWENNWELLPFACEKVWEQLEYIAVKRYSSVSDLQAELKKMKLPQYDWAAMAASLALGVNTAGIVSEPVVNDETTVLQCSTEGDFTAHITALHQRLKNTSNSSPRAVFIGGDAEHTAMFAFAAPLQSDNYLQMWLA